MIPPSPFEEFTLLEPKAYSALHCPTLGFRGASDAHPCALSAAPGCFRIYDGVKGVMRLQATHRYALPKSSRTSVRLRLNDKQGTRHAVSLLTKRPASHPGACTIKLLNVPPYLLARPTPRLRNTVRTGFSIGRRHVQRRLIPQAGRCDRCFWKEQTIQTECFKTFDTAYKAKAARTTHMASLNQYDITHSRTPCKEV